MLYGDELTLLVPKLCLLSSHRETCLILSGRAHAESLNFALNNQACVLGEPQLVHKEDLVLGTRRTQLGNKEDWSHLSHKGGLTLS